jgi:K+-sensing histidine kinase KdpD
VNDDTGRFTLALGAGGAILLGAVLVLVREHTSASNLAFVFLLWTIVIGELGGRAAALATAVASALSFNFFLTRPYLTLVIDDPDDLVAFVSLMVCGLVAGASGRRREAAKATSRDIRADLELIDRFSRRLADDPGRRDGLAVALEDLRRSLRLRGLVVRDVAGRVVAAADPESLQVTLDAPAELQPDAWLRAEDTHHRFGTRGLRLPAEGGRIPLKARGGPVGTLDLWESDPAGLDHAQYQVLSVITRLIGAALSVSR